MKKLVVLCLAALLAAFSAIDADAGRFGLKGTIGFPDQHLKGASPIGYEFGITWQWNLPLWFAIQPDLVYSVSPQAVDGDMEAFKVGTAKLPVNVQWGPRFSNKNIRVFAQGSPYIGYSFAAKDVAYGAGLGVGLQLWCLQITGQYNWNMASFKKDSWQTIDVKQPDGVTLSVALMFGGKNKDNSQPKVKKEKKSKKKQADEFEGEY